MTAVTGFLLGMLVVLIPLAAGALMATVSSRYPEPVAGSSGDVDLAHRLLDSAAKATRRAWTELELGDERIAEQELLVALDAADRAHLLIERGLSRWAPRREGAVS